MGKYQKENQKPLSRASKMKRSKRMQANHQVMKKLEQSI